MCGNGENPYGVRLRPQACVEANRRKRRLLGRDIPYAVPKPGLMRSGFFVFVNQKKKGRIFPDFSALFVFVGCVVSGRSAAYSLSSRSCFILRK